MSPLEGTKPLGHGCPPWQDRLLWVVLDTSYAAGHRFQQLWQQWADDPARPSRLHVVALASPADAPFFDASSQQAPATLADTPQGKRLQQWRDQSWGLTPGWHRLEFEQGQVVLTLCVGEPLRNLRELHLQADDIVVHGLPTAPEATAPDIEGWTKGLARCCRRGTRLHVAPALGAIAHELAPALQSLGFDVTPEPQGGLQALYAPRWTPRRAPDLMPAWPAEAPRQCLVIGSGIAGAGCAAALARRGWQVTVIDAAVHPAKGASGLPAGLFSPHVSPNDGSISRLTRAGLRLTRLHAARLLREGLDWAATGVLEHRVHGKPGPQASVSGLQGWSEEASPEHKAQAHLPADAPATWHRYAGWLRPAQLVQALLTDAGAHRGSITWRGACTVQRLQRHGDLWLALDAQDQLLAQAPLVIVAAGPESRRLCAPAVPTQALRGQLTWAVHDMAHHQVPAFPVNGHGSFIGPLPGADHSAWYTGSTFDRDQPVPVPGEPVAHKPQDHEVNLAKLARLLPATAASVSTAPLHAWAGVRCTSPDRLPLVGPVRPDTDPGLWACTALGTRGLTWGLLCAELLACALEGEPLPLEASLARSLLASRPAPGKAMATPQPGE